jgi:serine phosphatase RsbU (regulator of sigma subunit)
VARPVGRFGPLLGAYPGERWEPLRFDVAPGDVLVLYSDGLVDAAGAHERFGPGRLRRTLTGVGSAAEAIERVEQALTGFEVGAQADDTAVLAVERVAVSEPRGPETVRATAAGA